MRDATHALSIRRPAQLAGISRRSVCDVPKSVGAADLVRVRPLRSAWNIRSWARADTGHQQKNTRGYNLFLTAARAHHQPSQPGVSTRYDQHPECQLGSPDTAPL